MNRIHEELSILSKDSPAAFITADSFSYLTINKIVKTIDVLKGKSISAGAGVLSASLVDATWNGAKGIAFGKRINTGFPDKELDIIIGASINISVAIALSNNATSVVSYVEVIVNNLRIHVLAENNMIIIEGCEFKQNRRITRTPDAEQILANAGIDPVEAAYVEGHIGYGAVSQALALTLGQRKELLLSDVFPAIDFGKSIKLAVIDNGNSIGIIPSESAVTRTSARCECSQGPDYKVDRSTITNTAPPNPSPNDEIGKIKIGGPVPDNKDPLRDFGRRPNASVETRGSAGVYIPHSFAEKLTVEVMPAVKIVASDNGTIGYKAEASVGFKNFRVSFDVIGGGILLDIDLDISISAYCDFELFKGVRVPIGWAIVMPEAGKSASLQLGFYPSVDNNGTISLKNTLKKSDMGEYAAVVIGIGTALEVIGVTAWIGFLIDVVLSTILSRGLPIELKKQIGKYVGNKEWKLIEGMQIIDPKEHVYPSAPFSVSKSSLLACFDYRG